MKLIRLFVFIFCLIIGSSFSQSVTVSGVAVPGDLTLAEKKLLLNGAGTREKYFMDMYVGALYLPAKSSDAKKIIAADESTAITLHIVSSLITSSRMQEAITEGFEKSTGGNTAALKDKINTFTKIFSEAITKQDIFRITYQTKEGLTVYKNGIKKGSIPGLDFKKALWGIWLGDDPADDDLKSAMLGK